LPLRKFMHHLDMDDTVVKVLKCRNSRINQKLIKKEITHPLKQDHQLVK